LGWIFEIYPSFVSRDFELGTVRLPSVCTSVRPQKVSSISMKFGMYVEVDE